MTSNGSGFDVSWPMDVAGNLVLGHPRWWIALGNFESAMLADDLRRVAIERPVFVAGLARAGTTVLLETLAAAPGVVTHRYRDYPFLFTPYWWRRYLEMVPAPSGVPVERAHRDRILITPESPEAMEEPLWMAFFGRLHEPDRSHVLSRSDENPRFERFYRDHIRKLLHVARATQYLAKANYNLPRLGYLARLFPDATFIVPFRGPQAHVASLMKQHRLYMTQLVDNPRARRYLRRAGHFEFGPDRQPINFGDAAAVAAVQRCWKTGRETEGWSRYWNQAYRWVLDTVDADPDLAQRVCFVSYEALCGRTAVLNDVVGFCGLQMAPEAVESAARRFSTPAYYDTGCTAAEQRLIDSICLDTHNALLGRCPA